MIAGYIVAGFIGEKIHKYVPGWVTPIFSALAVVAALIAWFGYSDDIYAILFLVLAIVPVAKYFKIKPTIFQERMRIREAEMENQKLGN